jgi:hypothetical protein
VEIEFAVHPISPADSIALVPSVLAKMHLAGSVLSNKPILIGIALAIVLAHLGRALLKIGLLSILSFKWLSQAEEKLKSYAEVLTRSVLDMPFEGELSRDLKLKVAQLVGLKTGIALFQNRKIISHVLILLSLAVLLVTYI